MISVRGALLVAVLIALTVTRVARAHDPGMSALSVTLGAAGRVAVVQLIVSDVDLLPQRRAHGGGCDTTGVLSFALASRALTPGVRCSAHGTDHTRFEATLSLPGPGALDVALPVLRELPRGHRCFARIVKAGSTLRREQILDLGTMSVRTDVSPQVTPSFLGLGVLHILTGLDHLLFLGVLLLGAESLARMLQQVTSFTLAHSTSLALSTLGVVHVPSAWAEAAIAASVVWVALRNCSRQRRSAEALGVTFGFGLIHGLGFASVLRELGVGAGADAVGPLLQFNLGVELGQLPLAALALPVVRRVRQLWPERGLRTISVAAAGVGAVWAVQRAQALWP